MKNQYAFILILLFVTSCVPKPVTTIPATLIPTSTQTKVPPTPTLTSTPIPLGYIDNDRDGLADQKETIAGTDPQNIDTDGDKISDYDEVTKYFLNPLLADTDGDGVLDNDLTERRENTDTLRAIIKIRQPFDIEEINDHFQDVTVVSETANSLTFEVVFYPNSYHIVEEILWNRAPDLYDGLDKYLTPDPIMNFDEEMSKDTHKLFASKNGITDLDVVRNMYAWTRKNVRVMPNASGSGDIPEPFLDLFVSENDQIIFPETPLQFNPQGNYTDWDMTHLILGKESFYNQTHGSCGSTANFHSTILRSVGIPTRIIQTIPLLDIDNAHQKSLLDNLSSDTRSKVTSQMGYNHFLVEAFIGNRWIRLNNSEFENHVEMRGAFIKVVAFSSWKEVDFAHPWGQSGRPYSLIEVDEQKAVHPSIIYDFSD